MKSVCFIGHRNAEVDDVLCGKIENLLIDLIKNFGVERFLFGSKSDFDVACYNIVKNLQNKFKNIKIVGYPCTSECFYLTSVVQEKNKLASAVLKKEICFMSYDELVVKEYAGKGSYLQRNQQMILDSDFCVFYFNKNYKPNKRHWARRDYFGYQPNSGTEKSFKFALSKKKKIFNVFCF